MSRGALILLTALFFALPVTLAPGPLSGVSEAQAGRNSYPSHGKVRAVDERDGNFKPRRKRAANPKKKQ